MEKEASGEQYYDEEEERAQAPSSQADTFSLE